MKRTWTIIGVNDAKSSFKWYQSLFGQPYSFASTISTWPYKGPAGSSHGSKRSHISIRILERRNSRFVIRTDTTSRSAHFSSGVEQDYGYRSLRSASSRRKQWDGVRCNLRVDGCERQPVLQRLRDDQSVEGVAVERWQASQV